VGDIRHEFYSAWPPKNLSNFKSTCTFKHALCWSCDYSIIPIVLSQESPRSDPLDLWRSKRYRLRAFVKFASENAQGSTMRPDTRAHHSFRRGLFRYGCEHGAPDAVLRITARTAFGELSGTGETKREASGEVDVWSKRLDLISRFKT
jgi:hypothetical protein